MSDLSDLPAEGNPVVNAVIAVGETVLRAVDMVVPAPQPQAPAQNTGQEAAPRQ